MASQKITYLFNADRQGWSESWYVSKASVRAALDAADAARQARMDLLGQGATIEAVRASDVAVPQDANYYYYPGGSPTSGPGARDNPTNAYYVRVFATELYHRQMWMRGMPDSWCEWSVTLNRYVFTALMGIRINAFFAKAIENGFQLQTVLRGAAAPFFRATTVAAGADGNAQLTVPGLAVDTASQVYFKAGVKSNVKYLNGRHWPYNIAPGGGTFQIPMAYVQGLPYKGGAEARKVGTGYINVTGHVPLRPGSRRVGRAFFVPAGRHSRNP